MGELERSLNFRQDKCPH